MEIVKHENIRYMPSFERHEPLILDHTAMKTMKECLKKYFFQIVIAKIPKQDEIIFTWGRAYHKFRESLEVTKDFNVAIKEGLKVWNEKQKMDPPPGHKFEFMTQARLLKSFAKGFAQWETEKKQGRIEVVAVEQPFNVQLSDGSFTSGRFDQVVRWNGKLWGRDFKTTSKEGMFYERKLEPNDQFTRYTFAQSKLSGERVQGQIIETLYNSKKDGPIINTYLTNRSEWQLDQWEKDQIFYNKVLKLSRQEDQWPMNESSCAFCPFHSVCKMPSEAAMVAKLNQDYITRPWDNTKV